MKAALHAHSVMAQQPAELSRESVHLAQVSALPCSFSLTHLTLHSHLAQSSCMSWSACKSRHHASLVFAAGCIIPGQLCCMHPCSMCCATAQAPAAGQQYGKLTGVAQGVSSDGQTIGASLQAMEQQADSLTSEVNRATQAPAGVEQAASTVKQLQSVASAGGLCYQAPAMPCLAIQPGRGLALTTTAAGGSRHNDAALHCDGNTDEQAVGTVPDASQQRLNGGGLATGTQPAVAAMDVAAVAVEEAAAAESAAATHMEEAAAPEAEVAAAATDEAAAPEAGATAAIREDSAVPEAVTAATNKAAAAEAAAPKVAVASAGEAAAPAVPAATNEAATPEAAPTVATASQVVPQTEVEAQSVVKQTSSENQRASPLSLVQLAVAEGHAAALGTEVATPQERFADLHALQVHHTSSSRVSILSHAHMMVYMCTCMYFSIVYILYLFMYILLYMFILYVHICIFESSMSCMSRLTRKSFADTNHLWCCITCTLFVWYASAQFTHSVCQCQHIPLLRYC